MINKLRSVKQTQIISTTMEILSRPQMAHCMCTENHELKEKDDQMIPKPRSNRGSAASETQPVGISESIREVDSSFTDLPDLAVYSS